jgi:hypothetical protein
VGRLSLRRLKGLHYLSRRGEVPDLRRLDDSYPSHVFLREMDRDLRDWEVIGRED